METTAMLQTEESTTTDASTEVTTTAPSIIETALAADAATKKTEELPPAATPLETPVVEESDKEIDAAIPTMLAHSHLDDATMNQKEAEQLAQDEELD